MLRHSTYPKAKLAWISPARYVQQGISREFAAILAQTEIGEGRRERLAPQVLELATGINFSGEGEESRLAIGRAFQSVLRLKAVRQTLT